MDLVTPSPGPKHSNKVLRSWEPGVVTTGTTRTQGRQRHGPQGSVHFSFLNKQIQEELDFLRFVPTCSRGLPWLRAEVREGWEGPGPTIRAGLALWGQTVGCSCPEALGAGPEPECKTRLP